MSLLLPLLFGCALLPAAEADKPAPLRYLRPAKEKLVLESEVVSTANDDGIVYVSRTERDKERMTLTLRFSSAGKLQLAEAALEAATRRTATFIPEAKGRGRLNRAGATDFLDKLPADPIVTTAPDWSDVFQLVKRYDLTKGGKQEFAGLWIHPVQPLRKLTFTVERVGENAVTVRQADKDVELKLNRFRVKLRSGEYVVWGDAAGRVLRLVPADGKGDFVVLEGFQAATKGLRP